MAPFATIVLHKREVEALHDIPNRNPMSQWLAVDFPKQKLYVCDGHRLLSAWTGDVDPLPPRDSYVPYAAVKATVKAQVMSTPLLIARVPGGFRVALLDKDTKTCELEPGEVLDFSVGRSADGFVPEVEVGAAVPRIEVMEANIRDLRALGATTGGARSVQFRAEYLATFGKLAKLCSTPAKLTVGNSDTEAALFEVAAEFEDTLWQYVLMPTKPYG